MPLLQTSKQKTLRKKKKIKFIKALHTCCRDMTNVRENNDNLRQKDSTESVYTDTNKN